MEDIEKKKAKSLNHNDRFIALDLSRGLAALSILVFHHYQFKQYSSLYSSVDFFFVLSGFVLLPSIDKTMNFKDAANFIRNRAVRLLPMSMCTILFVVITQKIIDFKHYILNEPNSEGLPTDPMTLISALLLLQVFSYSAQWLNGPLWSLSVEWISNLLIASSTGARKYRYFVIIIIAISLQIHSVFGGVPWELQLGRGLFAFILGAITRKFLFESWLYTRIKMIFSIIFFVALHGLLIICSPNVIIIAPFVFAYLILNASSIVISRKSILRISGFLGRYSYGFYAWHYPFLMLMPSLVMGLVGKNSSLHGWTTHLIFIATILMSLCMTRIVMHFIEPKVRLFFLPKSQ